jgi:hypothetical protein
MFTQLTRQLEFYSAGVYFKKCFSNTYIPNTEIKKVTFSKGFTCLITITLNNKRTIKIYDWKVSDPEQQRIKKKYSLAH